MQFRVLGPVELAVEGRRVALTSERQRAVLAALLTHPGATLTADQLIDVVWETTPPASALPSLHSHISRLRGVLADAGADGVVRTTGVGYVVDLSGHELDATTFATRLADAQAADSGDRVVAHLDEALALWRGPAFGQLATRPAIRPAAARLEQMRAAATADRVDALLALGGHTQVLGDLRAEVAEHPLAERPTEQLMLALYRSGRQADALEAYRALQQRLREDVGADPGPDLQRLHQQVLRQDVKLARPASGPSPATRPDVGGASHAPSAAPASDGLIGRDEAVTSIAGTLRTTRLLTLTGPGGVGKTRLAQAVAARIGRDVADETAICTLAPLRDPGRIAVAVLDALGIQHQGDQPAEETLLVALGTRRLLLVLDNCEHLLEAAARLVDRIGTRCPGTTVLATSRERLRLPGERVHEVDPLSVPEADADAAAVAGTAAGALLCARAHAAERSFALTDDNAATIAQVCQRLDGMPLAIELAAARLRALSPEALAVRLDHRFELLTGGPVHGPGRHRTLQATVEWSYALLTDAEARLFDRLSVFAGPFSLAAAEHVGAGEELAETQVAGVLAELVDKSLVVVDRDADQVRYRLLETLRSYGFWQLEARRATPDARDAHADHHVGLAERLGAAVRGSDERQALRQLTAVMDDLRLAHVRLVENEDVGAVLRLAGSLHDDLVFRPHTEVFGWADLAISLPGAADHASFPAALATAARGAMNAGDLDRADTLADAAVRRADRDDLATLWALYVRTTTALYTGRLGDALALADRRAAVAEALGSSYHLALAGVSRVLALRYSGETAAALDAAVQARRAAASSGNHTARAWALYSSGEALLDTDRAEAMRLLEQAIEAARHVDRRFIEGVAMVSLASLAGRAGELGRALGLFRDTIAHWRTQGVYTQQLTTVRNLVELLVRVGADEVAALLHGAVTVGATPSFGAEAERLDGAWTVIEQRMGVERAEAVADRGRHLTREQMVQEALSNLDVIIAR